MDRNVTAFYQMQFVQQYLHFAHFYTNITNFFQMSPNVFRYDHSPLPEIIFWEMRLRGKNKIKIRYFVELQILSHLILSYLLSFIYIYLGPSTARYCAYVCWYELFPSFFFFFRFDLPSGFCHFSHTWLISCHLGKQHQLIVQYEPP